MSYFDDISFSYVGSLDAYKNFTRTRIQDSCFWSFEYCHSGHFLFAKNSEKAIKVDGPIFFWMSPGNYYSYGSKNYDVRSHAWANCSGTRAERIINTLDQMWPEGYVKLEKAEDFSNLYFKMLDYIESRSKENHYKAVLCLEQLIGLLTELYQKHHAQPLVDTKMDALVKRIRFSPFMNYDFKAIAAKEFKMSYSGFRKFFKRVNRIPPHEYVISHRIYFSMELLKNNDLQIQEIAAKLGFNNFSIFSRLFKKKTGLSPSHYRKKYPLIKNMKIK